MQRATIASIILIMTMVVLSILLMTHSGFSYTSVTATGNGAVYSSTCPPVAFGC
jgi:hypothetical protein